MLNRTKLAVLLVIAAVMVIGIIGFGVQLHTFAGESKVETQKALDEKKQDEAAEAKKIANEVIGNTKDLSRFEVEFKEDTDNDDIVETDYQNEDGTTTHYQVNKKTGEVEAETELEDGTGVYEKWETGSHTKMMITTK